MTIYSEMAEGLNRLSPGVGPDTGLWGLEPVETVLRVCEQVEYGWFSQEFTQILRRFALVLSISAQLRPEYPAQLPRAHFRRRP